MKFGKGYKHLQSARRVFAIFPVRDKYGYWLWLETVIYDPKDSTYREIA